MSRARRVNGANGEVKGAKNISGAAQIQALSPEGGQSALGRPIFFPSWALGTNPGCLFDFRQRLPHAGTQACSWHQASLVSRHFPLSAEHVLGNVQAVHMLAAC